MSTTREIFIEDQHGGTLHVTMDESGGIGATATPAEDRPDVEIDETDRRDLADFLNGAR